jgi:hypothetical protein
MMIDKGIQDAEHPAAAGTEGGPRPTGVPAAADSTIRPADAPIDRQCGDWHRPLLVHNEALPDRAVPGVSVRLPD